MKIAIFVLSLGIFVQAASFGSTVVNWEREASFDTVVIMNSILADCGEQIAKVELGKTLNSKILQVKQAGVTTTVDSIRSRQKVYTLEFGTPYYVYGQETVRGKIELREDLDTQTKVCEIK